MLKKRFLAAACCFLLILPAVAQVNTCLTDAMLGQRRNDASYRLREQQSHAFPQSGPAMMNNVKTLPVVVHIIHHGGVENISDAQVFSQMDVLNADFRKANADTANTHPLFKAVAADMELEFCLATRDTSGNPTNGIHRVFTADTTLFFWEMIRDYGWNNKRYINIYVTRNGSSFSSFPWDADSLDGIFTSHGRFGTIGTAGSEQYSEFAKFGRTCTHEMGHYLGLYHTFSFLSDCDSNCVSSGDYVCDTPPADLRWFVSECMPQSSNTCMESPDLPDQVDNYMDYNTDSCANMFSLGQKQRGLQCLLQYRPQLSSQENLLATGCASLAGIGNNAGQIPVTVAPNPAGSYAEISFGNPSQLRHSLWVYNVQGQLVRTVDGIREGTVRLERNGLENGLYFFRLIHSSGITATGKIVLE